MHKWILGVNKPLCVIVGFDGFDPDVLANQLAFYHACGYRVRISRVPLNCDLLVVQRGPYDGEVFPTRAAGCHIYDYAAGGTSDFHVAFPEIPECVVIAPGKSVSGSRAPLRQIRGIHPVCPALWRASEQPRLRKSPYAFVHVGHRKPNPARDVMLLRMDEVALSGRCHFWGNGWQAASRSSTIHGPASLHECQGIYRRSTFALGVMYPFQRGRTISGRMWQAPLNGCILFSEALLPEVCLPGVVRCDDFLSALDAAPETPGAIRLIEAASEFWEDHTSRLALALGLSYSAPPRLATMLTYLKWVYARHIEARCVPPGKATAKLTRLLRRAA